MAESGKVTIVTGYYNRVDQVDDSIQSLLNQDYKDYEILVFDDASTDGTLGKLKRYEETNSNLRVIQHEQNIGFVRGLIYAINTIDSQYIAIHGSGDISQPSRIRKQVAIFEQHSDVGVVGCTVNNIQLDENYQVFRKNKISTKKFHGSAEQLVLKKSFFTHGEVMFRREVYEMVGGYRTQFKFAMDIDLWCRMSRVCNFYIIPEDLYTRYLLPDGVGTKIEKLFIQRLLVEVARQCHERILEGRDDYIERYGDQGFFFIKYTKRISKEFFIIAHKRFRFSKYEDSRFLAKFLFSKTKNYYSIKAYVKYVILFWLTKKYYQR